MNKEITNEEIYNTIISNILKNQQSILNVKVGLNRGKNNNNVFIEHSFQKVGSVNLVDLLKKSAIYNHAFLSENVRNIDNDIQKKQCAINNTLKELENLNNSLSNLDKNNTDEKDKIIEKINMLNEFIKSLNADLSHLELRKFLLTLNKTEKEYRTYMQDMSKTLLKGLSGGNSHFSREEIYKMFKNQLNGTMQSITHTKKSVESNLKKSSDDFDETEFENDNWREHESSKNTERSSFSKFNNNENTNKRSLNNNNEHNNLRNSNKFAPWNEPKYGEKTINKFAPWNDSKYDSGNSRNSREYNNNRPDLQNRSRQLNKTSEFNSRNALNSGKYIPPNKRDSDNSLNDRQNSNKFENLPSDDWDCEEIKIKKNDTVIEEFPSLGNMKLKTTNSIGAWESVSSAVKTEKIKEEYIVDNNKITEQPYQNLTILTRQLPKHIIDNTYDSSDEDYKNIKNEDFNYERDDF